MRGVGSVFAVEQGVRLCRTVQVRELCRKWVKISDVGHKNIVCAGHIHRKLTGNSLPLKRGNKRCNQRKQLIVQQNSDFGCITHTDRETDTKQAHSLSPQPSRTPRLLRPRWASRRLRHTRFASVRHTHKPHPAPRCVTPHARAARHAPPQPATATKTHAPATHPTRRVTTRHTATQTPPQPRRRPPDTPATPATLAHSPSQATKPTR